MAVMAYRTRDGLADYGFSIDYQPSMGWRVYIVFRPFYQSQDDGLLLPYQALDEDKRYYVDWSGKLDSLGDAKTVAELWAELAQGYRRDQEQKAFREERELIERYRRDQKQKKAASTDSDRLGEVEEGEGTLQAGEPGPGPAVIPHPRVSAESFDALPESA
jgi:hypothetical protein